VFDELLAPASDSVHRVANGFAVVKILAGSLLDAHTGVAFGWQRVPVVPTSASLPWMAT
jgi:hypothetical protein